MSRPYPLANVNIDVRGLTEHEALALATLIDQLRSTTTESPPWIDPLSQSDGLNKLFEAFVRAGVDIRQPTQEAL